MRPATAPASRASASPSPNSELQLVHRVSAPTDNPRSNVENANVEGMTKPQLPPSPFPPGPLFCLANRGRFAMLDQHEAKHEYLETAVLELPEDRSGMIDRHVRMLNTKVKVGSFLIRLREMRRQSEAPAQAPQELSVISCQ